MPAQRLPLPKTGPVASSMLRRVSTALGPYAAPPRSSSVSTVNGYRPLMTSESGIFWLATDPENKLPGHLSFTADGAPLLSLHGHLTPSMQVIAQDPRTGVTTYGPADDIPNIVVHGLLEQSPRRVTLLDCITTGRTEVLGIGVPLRTHTMRAAIMLRGGYVAGREETFSGLRLRTAGIDGWAGLPPAQAEVSDEAVAVSLPVVTKVRETTSKEVELSIYTHVSSSWGSSTEGRVKRSVWIEVGSFGGLTLRELDRNFASPIASYLSFATHSHSRVTAMQVRTGNSWLEVRHSGIRQDTPNLKNGHMLLPLSVAGLEVLSGFLNVYEATGPVAPVIANLLPGGSNPNVETQVLELTTIAEGMHRSLFPMEVRMSLEMADRWKEVISEATIGAEPRHRQAITGLLSRLEEAGYRQRLQRLALEVEEAMPGVCGNTSRWVKIVYDARNLFAHRTHGFLELAKIDEFYAVSQSLRWVLMGVLLLHSGLSADLLAARLREAEAYRWYLINMHSTLPPVFGGEA